MSNLDKKLRETLHKVGTVKIRSALDEVIEDGVAQIKQAFAEEGWIDVSRGASTWQVIETPIEKKVMMTGAEWYERFVYEMGGFKPEERNVSLPRVVRAAKRAAGLEEENKE